MENAVNMSISPFQLLIAMAFQIWIIVFPILILKRLKRLEDTINELTIDEVSISEDA